MDYTCDVIYLTDLFIRMHEGIKHCKDLFIRMHEGIKHCKDLLIQMHKGIFTHKKYIMWIAQRYYYYTLKKPIHWNEQKN